MAKRKLTPKQIAAGFGGKAAQRGRSRKARKSTVANKSPKKHRARRALSGISARINPKRAAIRAVAGAAATYAPAIAGDFGPGIALTAAGILANDDTLAGMGEVSVGAAAARALGGAAGFAAPSGVRFV